MSVESNALREKVEAHIMWRDDRFFGSNDTKTEPMLRDMLAQIESLTRERDEHEADIVRNVTRWSEEKRTLRAEVESLKRERDDYKRGYVAQQAEATSLRAELEAATNENEMLRQVLGSIGASNMWLMSPEETLRECQKRASTRPERLQRKRDDRY